MDFEALETICGALESSFEADFGGFEVGSGQTHCRCGTRPTVGSGSGQTHDQRGSRPTASVGLTRPTANVGPDPRPAVGLVWPVVSFVGVVCRFSFLWVFLMVWVSLFCFFSTFVELMRCHIGIGCCKVRVLQHELTIGALI
jgi:hypothetical protein